METDANPMQSAHAAPRCHAKAKTTGNRCKAPAKRGWSVCRMHGAGGGAPTGPANGAWVHGGRSNDVNNIRSMVAECLREARFLRGG
jgi:hypothetical protein